MLRGVIVEDGGKFIITSGGVVERGIRSNGGSAIDIYQGTLSGGMSVRNHVGHIDIVDSDVDGNFSFDRVSDGSIYMRDINFTKPGSITVRNSTVSNLTFYQLKGVRNISVSSTSARRRSRVFESIVTGNIRYTGNDAWINISNNTIAGSVSIRNNTRGVFLGVNQLNRPVSISGNTVEDMTVIDNSFGSRASLKVDRNTATNSFHIFGNGQQGMPSSISFQRNTGKKLFMAENSSAGRVTVSRNNLSESLDLSTNNIGQDFICSSNSIVPVKLFNVVGRKDRCLN